jgi:hypothetical protein
MIALPPLLTILNKRCVRILEKGIISNDRLEQASI